MTNQPMITKVMALLAKAEIGLNAAIVVSKHDKEGTLAGLVLKEGNAFLLEAIKLRDSHEDEITEADQNMINNKLSELSSRLEKEYAR